MRSTIPCITRKLFKVSLHSTHYFQRSKNRIGGVMVSMLGSGAVDRGFEPWSDQTKDYTIKLVIAASPLSTQL